MNLACGYRNGSNQMVIIRCAGADGFYLERVVFPFELLTFECPPQSELEIWTHGLGGAQLLERLKSQELLIEASQGPNPLEIASSQAGAILELADGEPTMPWAAAG
jgi:hypothetical protein